MRTVAWDPLVNDTVTFLLIQLLDLHAFTGLYSEGRGGYYTQRGGEGTKSKGGGGTIPRGEERVLYPEGRGG